MNLEVRPFRGGENDPFRGEVDRAAAMRSWLAAVEHEPERRVRASSVMLQGIIGAHRDQRQQLLDQLWNDLIALEIDQELAERLDDWAEQHELEQADALAARCMQRSEVPAAVVQSTWLRELERRGGAELDWTWLLGFGEPSFLTAIAGRANILGYDGCRLLLPRMIELDRREALKLLKHLGLSEAGVGVADLAEHFGAEAVLRLSPPVQDKEHWAWLRLNYQLVGLPALALAERWVIGRGDSEQRLELGIWLHNEGDDQAALRVLGEILHPLRYAMLERCRQFNTLVELLWPVRHQIDALERLRLGRALLAAGDEKRLEELLADEAGEEAFGLRLEVAAAKGDAERVAQMVTENGIEAVVDDGHLRWALFEVLNEYDSAMAVSLVKAHLDAAPTPQALQTLARAELGASIRLQVLDALLLRQPTLALFKERLEGAVGADRLRLLQQRSLWRQRPSTAVRDLEELADIPQGKMLAMHTARRLLLRFSGAHEILDVLVTLAERCDSLEEVIEPVLLCAASLDSQAETELLGRTGLAFLRSKRPDLALFLQSQMTAPDPDAPSSLMLDAHLQALDGHAKEACRALVEAAVREPIREDQVQLARLAVSLGGLERQEIEVLAQRWPQDGLIVCSWLSSLLKAGEEASCVPLLAVETLPVEQLTAAIAQGLRGDLQACVALLSPDDEIAPLRSLAISLALRKLLDGLASGPWDGVGGLDDWVGQACESQLYDQALALCTEAPVLLSIDVLRSLLNALAQGGRDDRAEVIALRAMDLGLWDEHLLDVAQNAKPSSELFRRVLEHDACNLGLIARARAAEPGLAIEMLRQTRSALGRAASLGLGETKAVELKVASQVFEAAVAEIGRAPLLLRWWTEAVGDVDEALLEEAISANPGRWAARRLLGAAKRKVAGDRASAKAMLERGFSLCPEDADVRRALSDLWRQDDPQRALQFLAPLLDIEEPAARDLRRRGRIELAQGDLEAAAQSFALSGLPKRAGPMADALHAFMGTGRWELGAQWCEALIRQHGHAMSSAEMAKLYADLGRIRLGLAQPVAAAISFERALEFGDDSGELLEGLGMALLNVPGRKHEALKTLERALPKVPIERRLGLLLLRIEEAEDAWQVVDLLDSYKADIGQNFALIERLAKAYRSTARYDEAFAAGLKALDQASEEQRPPMLTWIGSVAYEHLTDLRRALASWNAALDIAPESQTAMDAIEAACLESEAWDLLVLNLQRQVERFGEDQAEQRYGAWARVSRLARHEMQRLDLAVVALSEMIAITDLSATRIELAQVLSELERWEEVIPLLQPVWQVRSLSDEGAQCLLKAFEKSGHIWRAVAVADVLALRGLDGVGAEERKAWRDQCVATMPLTAAEQNVLLPPLLRGEVGEALAGAWHLLHQAIERDPQRPGGILGRRHRPVNEEDERLAVQVFYRVARFFRQPETSLYLIPRSSDNLRIFPSRPLSLTAGEHAAFLRDDDQAALRFNVGRILGLLRPEVALISAIGLQGLADLIAAVGLRMQRPDPTMVGHWRELLSGGLEFRLRVHLARLCDEPFEHLAGAAERLSLCSGLVACGDLAVALEEAKRCAPLHARLKHADVEELFCRIWSGEQRFVARVG